jgi:arylsulfatase A
MLQLSVRFYQLLFTWLGLPVIVMAQPARPNIILIYADDLGYGDVSCYGATAIKTPNVDKLAANGVRFTNAHCAASTCTPSRYAMMTGEYAWRKKGTGILPGNAALIIPQNKKTLPMVFKRSRLQNCHSGQMAFRAW